jgi:hypothetical protein
MEKLGHDEYDDDGNYNRYDGNDEDNDFHKS